MNPDFSRGVPRRDFLSRVSLGTAAMAAALNTQTDASPASPSAGRGRTALAEPAFRPLPLGSVVAEGWLRRQLRQQADGLSGHLDEFWPDVAESQWFGGRAEGWERAPYWLDGVIPLAWVLDDESLKSKVRQRVRQILAGQRADGWYAPYPQEADGRRYDLWAILLVNKVLAQYHEATGEAAVLEAVMRNLRALHEAMRRAPLFNWGQFRWFEGLVSVYYAYEHTGQAWLLDLARLLHEQGFDYRAFYAGPDIVSPTPRRGRWTWEKHVVNTAMALKAYALLWRLTGRAEDRDFARQMLAVLDRYHGQVHGLFSGDECLAGRSPSQGTELCAVVEALYSLEWLAALTGDPAFADRLERVAFNALPATFAPDLWSHQYDQQVNQVQCTINPDHMWSTNGPESNLFGLEPNYGCCLANMHQGWPKFAAHLWMRTPEGGLAAVAYAPATVRLDLQGRPVRVCLDTDYPFRETLRLVVEVPERMRFPLWLRVPGWTRGATLRLPDGRRRELQPGTFHRLTRSWSGTSELSLHFPMSPRVTRRYNQALALERGPLVFALNPRETWKQVNTDKPHRQLPHADFEVTPASPWNYGLFLDEARPETSVRFEERPVGERPFAPEGAGVIARVRGRRLPNWNLEHGWAAEISPQPQPSREPVEELTLIPYGCAKLRVTEFPRLAG